MELVPVNPMWFLTLMEVRLLTSPQRLGDRDPVFRCWVKPTVNCLGSLLFSQAALQVHLGSPWGCLETMLVLLFVHVLMERWTGLVERGLRGARVVWLRRKALSEGGITVRHVGLSEFPI